MNKIIKFLKAFFKWGSILIGAPILLYLIYTLIMSAFVSLNEDITDKDKDFKFKLSETDTIKKLPNILLINADDVGYADIGCYGSSAIATPNIDAIAANGMKFTNHYTCAAVCSPSRVGLLTGRYPIRSGIVSIITPNDWSFKNKFAARFGKLLNVVGAADHGQESYVNGLPNKEITLAEALKQRGYATGITGKWHLGDFKHKKELSPLNHGFDDWLGINAANDERPVALIDGYNVIKDNITDEDQADFTERFTNRAISFIEKNKNKPFFYYLAYTAAHQPLVPSAKFKNKSKGGTYGDVVEEMDHGIGRVLETLKKNGLDENTIVIFTSDNGPWFEGSTGGLRGGKGQPFEGAFKVPLIVTWKNHIISNTSSDLRVSNLDIFPTLLNVVGLGLPKDRIIDGVNIKDILTGKSQKEPHDYLYFYHYEEPVAILNKDWKYYANANTYVWPVPVNKKGTVTESLTRNIFGDMSTFLFNLKQDPNEDYNTIKQHPTKADSLSKVLEHWKLSIKNNVGGWIK